MIPASANPLLPAVWEWTVTGVALVFVVLVVVALVRIDRTKARREPMATMWWALAVLALPVVGVLAWFVHDRRASRGAA
ncbi:PLD nuclease N-terminal domain-containing protein [Zafaria sp. Z1313]|uniref:PLD nuclease N-terminal domain-containing protein n=1 Tax=unclassified Zafaria TaxID=2828765 RepID=UPI002E7A4E02|nr:PLD nuclease N-terminal domain-containing protein [Zafaria sp. J156]MEE1621023.1 PLD nuclease N-terminal domain-containing protein [Zafaria sp. J156]